MLNKKLAKALIEIKRLLRNSGRSDILRIEVENIIKDISFIELEKILNSPDEKLKGFKAHGRTYDYEEENIAEKGKEALKRLRSRN